MPLLIGANKKIHKLLRLPFNSANLALARSITSFFYQAFSQAMPSLKQDFKDFGENLLSFSFLNRRGFVAQIRQLSAGLKARVGWVHETRSS